MTRLIVCLFVNSDLASNLNSLKELHHRAAAHEDDKKNHHTNAERILGFFLFDEFHIGVFTETREAGTLLGTLDHFEKMNLTCAKFAADV